ncbi:hypothetical protein ACP4OV_013548 [Aristida adscensionis]
MLRPAGRRAPKPPPRTSEEEEAIAEVRREVRAQLRAWDSDAAHKSWVVSPTSAGIVFGLLIATVVHMCKPEDKTAVDVFLEIAQGSKQGPQAKH